MEGVSVEPPSAQFPASGGVSMHQVVNQSAGRLAFKIKCSDNDHYRLNPVYGFVESGGAGALEITRLDGPAGEGKIVVQLIQVTPDDADAAAIFKGAQPQGQLDVPLSAQ